MAINNFIPAIWSARMLSFLDKSLVYAQDAVVNRDYEGEIKDQGDRVKINQIGDITISNYVKNTDLAAPQELSDSQRELIVDQAKSFFFQVDDIDKAQQNPKIMDTAMERAAFAMADIIDSWLAGFHTDADATNNVGTTATPIALTSVNAYATLVDCAVNLSKNNVGREGRFVIVPPEFVALLQKDSWFVGVGGLQSEEALRNGVIGKAAGFTIYESNNVAVVTGSKYKILFGNNQAISYAEQIASIEALRLERRFADAVKGLHVYGAKVVQPKALGCLTATF